MTDKMLKDFEVWWAKNYDANKLLFSGKFISEYAYVAATAESTAKIAQMQARIDELVEALKLCNKRLAENGQFAIDEVQSNNRKALAKVKDEK